MDRQHAHADWAFLPWGHFPERPNILLGAEIELASSFIKDRLNKPALLLMLLAVFVLTFLVAIPNALAPVALLECIALLAARRTELGWVGPNFRGGFGAIIFSLRRFAERHGAELLSSGRSCSVLFRRRHDISKRYR